MSKKNTALTLAVGSAFAASLVSLAPATAGENPFELESLQNGYQIASADKSKDGKCGEGQCGGAKKDKEGGCGGDKKDKEGASGGDKQKEGKCGEGKCGEGKCGGNK